jgi:phenylacetate-CoA ligase
MIWNEKMECASRDEMAAVQSERLVQTVQRIYHNIPGYRAKMQEKGMTSGRYSVCGRFKQTTFHQ